MALYGDTSRTLKETQEMGESTLFAMGQQREQFQQTQNKAKEVSGFTKQTHAEINRMGRRRTLKRMTLWLIIFVQFVIIGGLFYRLCTNGFKLLKHEEEEVAKGEVNIPDDDDHFP